MEKHNILSQVLKAVLA